jgi:large subunit ribosomal protein L3
MGVVMAKGHKPVSGSRAFWPRKRAKRIYPTPKIKTSMEKPLPLGFAAYKAGMTKAIYTDTRKTSTTSGQTIAVPVTVFDAPPLTCIGIKIYKKTPDGLKNMTTVWTEKLPKDLARKTRIPTKIKNRPKIEQIEKEILSEGVENKYNIRLLVSTNPRESGIGKKKPEVFELPLSGSLKDKWETAKQKLGTELLAKDIFEEGEFVDVSAVSKGKGFQGPVKRFGVKIRSRKNEKKRRHVGNIGAVTPARVLPGKIAMAGQLGFQTRTELNKRILKLGDGGLNPKGDWLSYGKIKGDYIILEGSVPGPRKRLVVFRKAVRSLEKEKEKVEVKKVLLESLQGA